MMIDSFKEAYPITVQIPKEPTMSNQKVSNEDIQKLTKILMSGRMGSFDWLHSFVSNCPAHDLGLFLSLADKADIDSADESEHNSSVAPIQEDSEPTLKVMHFRWYHVANMFHNPDQSPSDVSHKIKILKAIRQERSLSLVEAKAIYDNIMYDVYDFGSEPESHVPDLQDYLDLRETIQSIRVMD